MIASSGGGWVGGGVGWGGGGQVLKLPMSKTMRKITF